MTNLHQGVLLGANLLGLGSAAFGAAYAAYIRPGLAEKYFIAEAVAIRARVDARIRSGSLPADDRRVVRLLLILDSAASDPCRVMTELEGVARRNHEPPAAEIDLNGDRVKELDGLRYQLCRAISRFSVDGSPWWLVRRLFGGRPAEVPLAALLMLPVANAPTNSGHPAGFDPMTGPRRQADRWALPPGDRSQVGRT